MNRLISNLPVLLAFTLLLGACQSTKNLVYFRNDEKADPELISRSTTPSVDGIIQSDDVLAINTTTISSLNEKDPVGPFKEGGTPFATSAGSTSGGGVGTQGYLVDKQGNINFPVVGAIQVAGLTIPQAKQAIAAKLRDYVKEPIVEVRILNYKITVLGEVGRPGTVLAPNHKLSIIEAIASSGDIPSSGRKDNVLIIRESDGKREFARLNLNSRDVFNSPYFYLKQNDIVYVEASKLRKQDANAFLRLYFPTIMSTVTTALAIYSFVLVSNNNK